MWARVDSEANVGIAEREDIGRVIAKSQATNAKEEAASGKTFQHSVY